MIIIVVVSDGVMARGLLPRNSEVDHSELERTFFFRMLTAWFGNGGYGYVLETSPFDGASL